MSLSNMDPKLRDALLFAVSVVVADQAVAPSKETLTTRVLIGAIVFYLAKQAVRPDRNDDDVIDIHQAPYGSHYWNQQVLLSHHNRNQYPM